MLAMQQRSTPVCWKGSTPKRPWSIFTTGHLRKTRFWFVRSQLLRYHIALRCVLLTGFSEYIVPQGNADPEKCHRQPASLWRCQHKCQHKDAGRWFETIYFLSRWMQQVFTAYLYEYFAITSAIWLHQFDAFQGPVWSTPGIIVLSVRCMFVLLIVGHLCAAEQMGAIRLLHLVSLWNHVHCRTKPVPAHDTKVWCVLKFHPLLFWSFNHILPHLL